MSVCGVRALRVCVLRAVVCVCVCVCVCIACGGVCEGWRGTVTQEAGSAGEGQTGESDKLPGKPCHNATRITGFTETP